LIVPAERRSVFMPSALIATPQFSPSLVNKMPPLVNFTTSAGALVLVAVKPVSLIITD